MSPLRNRAQTALTSVSALGFLLLQPALAVEVNVHTPEIHVPTPQIHVPTPQVHVPVPTAHIKTLDVGGRQHLQFEHKGDLKTGRDTDLDKSQKGNNATTDGGKTPVGASTFGDGKRGNDKPPGGSSPGLAGVGSSGNIVQPPGVGVNAPIMPGVTPGVGAAAKTDGESSLMPNQLGGISPLGAGSGTPKPGLLTFYPSLVFFPFDEISRLISVETNDTPINVGATATSIENGADDAAYSAVIAADLASVAAAQQAQTTAAACAVDSALAGCSSAESVQQATANLANAVNTYQDFYSDINYLLWLFSLIESGIPLPPGFSPAATAAVEAALAACLASPSTCDATIAQLETVLAELGVPSQVMTAGGTLTIMQTQSEIAGSSPIGTVEPGPQPSLSDLLSDYFIDWGFVKYIAAAG